MMRSFPPSACRPEAVTPPNSLQGMLVPLTGATGGAETVEGEPATSRLLTGFLSCYGPVELSRRQGTLAREGEPFDETLLDGKPAQGSEYKGALQAFGFQESHNGQE